MGGDGGSIPTRLELVKVKKGPEKIALDAKLNATWQYCYITKEALQPPLVMCELGRVYNLESVLNFLLNKDEVAENVAEACSHIKTRKDFKKLNLTPNEEYDGTSSTPQFRCPVTSLPMNGKHQFNALWTCGCVISDRGMREVKSEACHKCGVAFTEDDVVILHPNVHQEEVLLEKMIERRKKRKSNKKKDKVKSDGKEEKKAAVASEKSSKQVKRKVDDKGVKINSAVLAEIKADLKSSHEEDEHKKKQSKAYASIFADKSKGDVNSKAISGFGQTFF